MPIWLLVGETQEVNLKANALKRGCFAFSSKLGIIFLDAQVSDGIKQAVDVISSGRNKFLECAVFCPYFCFGLNFVQNSLDRWFHSGDTA